MPGDKRVDYDRIAAQYNRRFQGEGQRGTATALQDLAHQYNAERILEVGCGTGRWLADLRSATPALFGLDLSAGMLHEAQERDPQMGLVRGQAGQLPFPNATFDLIYCVNAIHHFQGQAEFVQQAARLLRPGGQLAVVGMDPRQQRDKWYVYDYFPGTYPADLERFPSWGQVMDWMVAAGLIEISWRLVERIYDPKQGRRVLSDPFLEKNAASQLALLSDQEYAAGIKRIQRALAKAEAAGDNLVFPVEILSYMLVGKSPLK